MKSFKTIFFFYHFYTPLLTYSAAPLGGAPHTLKTPGLVYRKVIIFSSVVIYALSYNLQTIHATQ